jgi:hypothetical protein
MAAATPTPVPAAAAVPPEFTPVREQPLPDWPSGGGGGTSTSGDPHRLSRRRHPRAELRPAAPLARALSCASCGGLLREAVVAADCCLSAFCYDCVAGAPLLMAAPPAQSPAVAAKAAAAAMAAAAASPSPRPRGRPPLSSSAADALISPSPRPQHLAKGSAAAAAVDACPACGALLGGNPWATGKLRYDPALDGLVRRVFPRPLLDAALERRRAERGAAERAARAAALAGGRRGGGGGGAAAGAGARLLPEGQKKQKEQEEEEEEGQEGEVAAALALFPARDGGGNGSRLLPELERPYVVVPERSRVRDVLEHVRQALGALLVDGEEEEEEEEEEEQVEKEEEEQGAAAARPAAAFALALRTEGGAALDPDLTVGEAVRMARREAQEEEEEEEEEDVGAPPAPVVLCYDRVQQGRGGGGGGEGKSGGG